MTPENKTRFQTIVCTLIAADQIYPTGIISEFHAEWGCTEEGKRRIVMAAVSCNLAEIDALVGNVFDFEVDHLDCATAIADGILRMDGNPLPNLGQELARKVRDRIFMGFETCEYMSPKELWFAFKNHSDRWPELYAEWLEEMDGDNSEHNEAREFEQNMGARAA